MNLVIMLIVSILNSTRATFYFLVHFFKFSFYKWVVKHNFFAKFCILYTNKSPKFFCFIRKRHNPNTVKPVIFATWPASSFLLGRAGATNPVNTLNIYASLRDFYACIFAYTGHKKIINSTVTPQIFFTDIFSYMNIISILTTSPTLLTVYSLL